MDKSITKILLVDDDPKLLKLLEDTLSTIGYTTSSVNDGKKALHRLEQESFNLVITDISMPEMDGFELLEKIRTKHSRLPVIFITGNSKPDFIGKAHPEGFLAKPFRISNLEEMIENTIEGKEDKIKSTSRKILVVDDDDNYREMLVDALKVCNYDALSAASPKEALRILENSQYDIVISDIKMPVMDGVSFAKAIKEKYPELPIILTTAYHTFERFVNDKEKNIADGILQKPFGLELIVQMLERVVKDSQRKVTA